MIKRVKKIKEGLKYIGTSIGVGAFISLISSLYKRDLTYGVGAHVTGYGFPLNWFKQVNIVYPGNPTRYSYSLESLLINIAFWSVFAAAGIGFYKLYKSRKT